MAETGMERVARALRVFVHDNDAGVAREAARAAIEAMREPTDYMLDETVGPDAKEFEVATVRAQWTDMIDAILKEEGNG